MLGFFGAPPGRPQGHTIPRVSSIRLLKESWPNMYDCMHIRIYAYMLVCKLLISRMPGVLEEFFPRGSAPNIILIDFTYVSEVRDEFLANNQKRMDQFERDNEMLRANSWPAWTSGWSMWFLVRGQMAQLRGLSRFCNQFSSFRPIRQTATIWTGPPRRLRGAARQSFMRSPC